MSQPTVSVCPLCGSKNVIVSEPDAVDTAAGATCALKCECGADVLLYVKQKGDASAAKEKAALE